MLPFRENKGMVSTWSLMVISLDPHSHISGTRVSLVICWSHLNQNRNIALHIRVYAESSAQSHIYQERTNQRNYEIMKSKKLILLKLLEFSNANPKHCIWRESNRTFLMNVYTEYVTHIVILWKGILCHEMLVCLVKVVVTVSLFVRVQYLENRQGPEWVPQSHRPFLTVPNLLSS